MLANTCRHQHPSPISEQEFCILKCACVAEKYVRPQMLLLRIVEGGSGIVAEIYMHMFDRTASGALQLQHHQLSDLHSRHVKAVPGTVGSPTQSVSTSTRTILSDLP